MKTFISQLEQELRQNSNASNAKAMKAYMKNHFEFLGIKTEARRSILKKCYTLHQSIISNDFREIAWDLYQYKEREFHQCAIDLLVKEIKRKYRKEDINFIEQLLTTHSWWDSVDVISKYLLGGYLSAFPEETLGVIEKFSDSENRWLNRSAILFQLSYKQKTDFELLQSECRKHKDSGEFFIQKAIGWALRDYGRFNPVGVKNFVENTNLKPLSRKEALRNIK